MVIWMENGIVLIPTMDKPVKGVAIVWFSLLLTLIYFNLPKFFSFLAPIIFDLMIVGILIKIPVESSDWFTRLSNRYSHHIQMITNA